MKTHSQFRKETVEDEIEVISESISLGRLGVPDEFGRIAVFRVSPATSFINGVMLNVDGGLHQGLF